jgi:hypothetical protein
MCRSHFRAMPRDILTDFVINTMMAPCRDLIQVCGRWSYRGTYITTVKKEIK